MSCQAQSGSYRLYPRYHVFASTMSGPSAALIAEETRDRWRSGMPSPYPACSVFEDTVVIHAIPDKDDIPLWVGLALVGLDKRVQALRIEYLVFL